MQCVVPENIHTPPSAQEGEWKFYGDWGVQKEAISEGVEACYRGLFQGVLSEIGELSIISIITLMIIENRAL